MAVTAFHKSKSICIPGHAPQCEIWVGEGALEMLPQALDTHGIQKPFLFADSNTYRAAGQQAADILEREKKPFGLFVFDRPQPDEKSVGLAFMQLDQSCDGIIGVGSGVINDICKIVAAVSGKPYIIIGTAPSMDGYASATSSMERQGLKVSLNSKCPDVIIGDTAVMAQAPMELLASGLGDMLAKYVSICEWRISHLINGEYYSEEIAQMVRKALKKCMDNADGLLNRDLQAVEAVFEGLAICGVAMAYAGLSRPASGCEHYISHVLDMRGAEFKTPVYPHGIQCAMGTLTVVRAYEKLRSYTPNREKALRYAAEFSFTSWSETLRRLLGRGAETMIAQEAGEGKYDVQKHGARLNRILSSWNALLEIMDRELPDAQQLERLLAKLQIPGTLEEMGTDNSLLPVIFGATRDIRDKYVLSRLLWDLGIAPEEILAV